MAIILVASGKPIDPLDDSGLYYAKPVNVNQLSFDITEYILGYRLHNSLNHQGEIGRDKAEQIASDIIKLIQNS